MLLNCSDSCVETTVIARNIPTVKVTTNVKYGWKNLTMSKISEKVIVHAHFIQFCI